METRNLTISQVSEELVRRFKAACAEQGYSMREVIIGFMTDLGRNGDPRPNKGQGKKKKKKKK